MAFNGRRRNAELFLVQLLTGGTIEDCATHAGISIRTAYRWLADNTFQATFRERKKQVLDRCTLQLTSEVSAAIRTLVELHKDIAQPGSARCSSAAQLIKQAYMNAGLGDIEERIRQLEEQHKGNPNPQEGTP
jgi:hypothetical protein